MPDVDSTFRTTGRWKYIIVSDLKNAFHQNHLAKPSLKYSSKVTLYLGIRVYTRCAMGMPGSKTTLEVVIFIVLENCLQDASRWSVLWRTNSKRTTLQPVKGTWVPNTKRTSFVQNHHMPSFNHYTWMELDRGEAICERLKIISWVYIGRVITNCSDIPTRFKRRNAIQRQNILDWLSTSRLPQYP